MIKRVMWFATGLATGAGAVIVLGKRMKRRLAELTPVRLADRGVQRVKQVGGTARQALREGVEAMRHREDELQDRFNGDRNVSDNNVRRTDDRNVIVLPNASSHQTRVTARGNSLRPGNAGQSKRKS